tara:strand:- start:6434 stop:6643 length:210 start_codon:yes stop_codon:yes gene_type:complete
MPQKCEQVDGRASSHSAAASLLIAGEAVDDDHRAGTGGTEKGHYAICMHKQHDAGMAASTGFLKGDLID